MAYVTWHVTYFRDLRIYIRSLGTKEEVAVVAYGMDIPAEYQSTKENNISISVHTDYRAISNSPTHPTPAKY